MAGDRLGWWDPRRASVALLALAIAGCSVTAGDDRGHDPAAAPAEFEGGKLSHAGRLPVARLQGSFRQMGRQYGALLKPQIRSFHQQAVVDGFPKGGKLSRDDLVSYARTSYQAFPAPIKDVFAGMAETSGLDVDELILLDQYPSLSEMAKMGGCSTIAAWGEYTGGGALVFGKNEDWLPYFRKFSDSLAVVVYNPTDGSHAVAKIANAGQVTTANSVNDAGVVLTEQYVPQFGEPANPSAVPPFAKFLMLMLSSADLSEVAAGLRGYRPAFNVLANLADHTQAVSHELAMGHNRMRKGRPNGLLVVTNHLVDPAWQVPERLVNSDDWKESIERLESLQAMAGKRKGAIDAAAVRTLLDTPKSDGGPFFADDPDFQTIFQFVAMPAELIWWLKVPGYQDWVELRLGPLFGE